MCLYTVKRKTNSHIKTAKKDKVVYKMFYEEGGFLISPFRGKKYILNKIYYIQDHTIITHWGYKKHNSNTIYAGIHSFRDSHSAVNSPAFKHSRRAVLYKCIIPKGSKYVLGTNSKKTTKEIVSSKIKILEKCVC